VSAAIASFGRALVENTGPARGKLALAACLLGGFALSLSVLLGNPGPSHAEAGLGLKSRELAQLKSLDSGDQAEVLDEGLSAQDRNELIPNSGLPLEHMGHFAVISTDNQQYSSALKCLTQAVHYEAANEPVQGKRAVAQVVLNRLRHPAYPNSVCGVVYEGVNQRVCQFSFTCDGSLLRTPIASKWQESRSVAEAALAGTIEKSVGSATHYHADYVLPRWAFTLGKVNKIGVHIFYRFPGSAGSEGAFSRRWNGHEAVPFLSEERLRAMLAANWGQPKPEPEYVPGTTVTPHVTDRHAPADVGGRIDTTKNWRLSIPDPVNKPASYGADRAEQRDAISQDITGGNGMVAAGAPQ